MATRHPQSFFLIATLALMAMVLNGCITWRLPPINAKTPNLGITDQERHPLNIAVIVPEPLGFRYIIDWNIFNKGVKQTHIKPEDWTDRYGGDTGMPIGPELVKLTNETFSQVFDLTAVVKETPGPGEYDAIVEIRVMELRNVDTLRAGMASGKREVELSLKWKLRVLDRDGVEIFSQEDITRGANSEAPFMFGLEKYNLYFGGKISDLLSIVAQDWGKRLHSSEEIKSYARRTASTRKR